MKIEEIQGRLDEIADIRADDEVAHSTEDSLLKEFIEYVAKSPNDSQLSDKAKMVLSTFDIEFNRWCA